MTYSVGDTIHVLESGWTFAGRVRLRGESITLTKSDLDLATDRNGNSLLDLTDEEQVGRWGLLYFQPGPAPEGMTPWDHDPAAREARRQLLINEAARISHPHDRRVELDRIAAEFGRPLTSTTLAVYAPDAENRYGPRPA